MSGLNDNINSDQYDNALIGVMGGSDNTRIGNVGDSLKTTATITQTPGSVPSLSSNLVYQDMALIARGTNVPITGWTKIYEYLGNGLLAGFCVTLETFSSGWRIRLVVDGKDVFGVNGILTDDLTTATVYGFLTNKPYVSMGIGTQSNTIFWDSPTYPMVYKTSVQIYLQRITSQKQFQAGLIALTKEV